MATYMRMSPSKMRDRIDASYYHPKFVFNELRLRNSGLPICELREIIEDGRRSIYFQTSTLEKNEAPSNWVPFLTSDDLGTDGIFVDLDARRRVSPTFADRYPNGLLRSNELLVKVKGPNQTTGYVRERPKKRILISGTIWGGIVAERVDPWYLVTALSSDYGAVARTRLRTNLNVEFLSPDDLLRMEIPIPDLSAQTYIGDKVRQAERLRARAQKLEEEIVAELESVVPPFEGEPDRTIRISHRRLFERLDARPYRTHFLSLLDAVSSTKNNNVAEIADLTGGDPVPSGEFCDQSIPLVRIRNIKPNGFIDQDVFVSPEYSSAKPAANAEAGWIVIGMDGEFRAQFFLQEELPQFINQRVGIVKCHKIRPELLSAWLNTNVGQMQLDRIAVRTTVDHISLDDIRNVKIPRLSNEVEERMANNVLFSRRAVFQSRRLTAAAKFLVEALIEGQTSEADLITVQKALEAGDRTPDREILSRLTRKGMDTPGEPPLFPDLDALYNALDALDTPEDAP